MSIKEQRIAHALNAISRSNIRSAFGEADLNNLIADYFGKDDEAESDYVDSESESDGEPCETGDETTISVEGDSPERGDDTLVTATEVADIIDASSRYIWSTACDENQEELRRIESFNCGCTLDHGNQCCKQFSPDLILGRSLDMQAFTEGMCMLFNNNVT
jgi:hypothetical protein